MGVEYCEDISSAVSLALRMKLDADGMTSIPSGVNIFV